MTKKYTLELTEKQMGVIQQALDMYFRVAMGQHTELIDQMIPPLKDTDEWCRRRDGVEEHLREARSWAMPDLARSAYYGIYAKEIAEENRIACDIHDVIRHHLAWERHPEGGFQVCFDTPMAKSEEPLPVVHVEEKP